LIRRILLYTALLIGLAYLLNGLLLEGLRRNRSGLYDKYTTSFLRANSYNTLMLGSSRSFMHIDNRLFDSLTGTHSFNLGLPGATTRMSYACLRAYLVHSAKPERVFLELDFHISHLRTDTIYNFSTYFPYLSNPELYRQFSAIDPRFRYFKTIPFYSLPYLGIKSLSASLNGWRGRSGPYDGYFREGFFENRLRDDYNNFRVKSYHGYICPESRAYLDSIIDLCRSNRIELCFTMSPAYQDSRAEVLNRDRIIAQYAAIAAAHRLPLFDFSSDSSIVSDPALFEDNYHLLYPGARMYTRKLAAEVNNKSHGFPLLGKD